MIHAAVRPPFARRSRATLSTIPVPPAAPDTPSTPSPADTATAYYTLLSWVSARATKFDIFLDTVNPPVARAVIGYYVGTSYVPTLAPSTTYYWKIVAYNDGGSATGPVWSFTTLAATAVIFSRSGSIVTGNARFPSLSIHDVTGAEPNTARMVFDTDAPSGAESIRIGLGTLDADDLIFGGEIQAIDQTYAGTPTANTFYPATLVDHTFRLNKRRPFGTWTDVSATTIAKSLVANYASGFTSTHVQENLPLVSINFDGELDFMSCMRSLATAIGTSTTSGKTKVDYAKDLWLYLTYTGEQPDPVDRAHPPLDAPSPIVFSVDHSQIRTRVYGKGHGEAVPTDVAAGETILPINDAVMFKTTGGRAVASTTSDGAQTERMTYEGVQLGGGGSLVGPGAAPSTAPVAGWSAGSGVSDGIYGYAYTDVTAAGESLPSPIGSVTLGTTPPAPVYGLLAPGNAFSEAGSGFVAGDTVEFICSYSQATTSTNYTVDGPTGASSGVQTLITDSPGFIRQPTVQLTYSTDAKIKFIHVWCRKNGGTYFGFEGGQRANNSAGGTVTINFQTPLNATTVPAAVGQIALTGIAVGASPTTSRKVYRTTAGGSQLKLLTTLANNTATTFTDSTADGTLGANVPTSDTSGLTQPSGQVNAGSTTLLTASAGPFQTNGGWATLSGGQTVRYTGISTNTLTGIPASGPGAITTTVLYGSQVLPASALTGINAWNGLARAMAKGSKVSIFVQRDDLAAQAALGAVELDDDGTPTDGIREYVITDERSTEDRMIALCDADLAIMSRPIVSASYYTRDIKTKAGRTVSIDLETGTFDPDTFDPGTFDVLSTWGEAAGNFTIQSVDITFDAPTLNPLRAVTATSVAFTLSDLLRRVVLSA